MTMLQPPLVVPPRPRTAYPRAFVDRVRAALPRAPDRPVTPSRPPTWRDSPSRRGATSGGQNAVRLKLP
ncbi:MAG: hypothetical protein JWR81_5166 [Pseudonocardia sp.]|jgi:hypothetical protein|nr:hypothetical protein [Pseudonocardia sp.]MDT7615381.1 hypothetical protein [Pseudonocardiales bacterium]